MSKKGSGGSGGAYRAFMEREGPQKLGTVEWPLAKVGALADQRFLITGILDTIERKEVQDLIKDCGGQLMTVVSKKLTYLVVGRDAGPAKLQKASDLDIPQVYETDFLEYLSKEIANCDGEVKEKVKPEKKKADSRKATKDKDGRKPSVAKRTNKDDDSSESEPDVKKPKSRAIPKKTANGSDSSSDEEDQKPKGKGKASVKKSPKKVPKMPETDSDDEDAEAGNDFKVVFKPKAKASSSRKS